MVAPAKRARCTSLFGALGIRESGSRACAVQRRLTSRRGRGTHLVAETEHGRVSVSAPRRSPRSSATSSPRATASSATPSAAGCRSCPTATGSTRWHRGARYRRRARDRPHVVVEYGLNLAEVASTVRYARRLRGDAADRPPCRRRRGAHRGCEAWRVTDIDRARELARRLARQPRGAPAVGSTT